MYQIITCFLLMAGFSTARACSNNSPFSADIIGRREHQDMTCFPTRYNNFTTVSVNATHLVYTPIRTGYNFGQFCEESYVFQINRWAPVMTHYPYLDDLSQNGHQICAGEQERLKVVASPHGSNREAYKEGLENTIGGLTLLRDSHCRQNGYGLEKTAYYHAWVQEPISFLRSVAYNYGLCLEI